MTILKQKKSHVTLTLFLALIGWLLMLPLPASAAAQAVPFEPVWGSFGIELTCKFADEEMVEHAIEDYQAYGFVLLDAAGRYVQADLAPDASFYLVSGSTVQGFSRAECPWLNRIILLLVSAGQSTYLILYFLFVIYISCVDIMHIMWYN